MTKSYPSAEALLAEINTLTVGQLRVKAREFDIIPRNRKRAELITLILASYNGQMKPEEPKKSGRPTKRQTGMKLNQPEPELVNDETSYDNVDKALPRTGILEIMPDGYGFVRTVNYSTTPGRDYYLSANVITRMNLKAGDKLKVLLHQYPDRAAPTAIYIQEVNDEPCNTIHRTLYTQ